MKVKRPTDITRKAQRECAEWLSACVGFGWKKTQLDALENIWWQFHDRLGNLMRPIASNTSTSPTKSKAKQIIMTLRDAQKNSLQSKDLYVLKKAQEEKI